VNTKFLIVAIACSVSAISPLALAEESYAAPLVKESLLLATSSGKNTIIVGERGHILVNEDNTKLDITSFKQILVPTKTTLTAVFSAGQLAWAVGHDATILKSTDAGLTWSLVQTFPELDRPLLSVYFFDENEGVAVGAYGLFYRSKDGGDSWQQEQHPSVVSDDDKLYLESIKDDQAFYQEELSFISPHLNRLTFLNGVLYLAGEAGLLAKSEDRGLSWLRLDIDYQGSFFDISSTLQQNILIGGLRGNIFVVDESQQRGIPTCLTTSINSLVRKDNNVFAFGNNGIMLVIDLDALESDDLKEPNNEGCQAHIAVSQVETDFSEAILSGIISKQNVLALTAGGLKMVAIEE